jgi:hypothetical protein
LQVQFEEMSGWSVDSDAAAMLSNLGIWKASFYIDRPREKIKVRSFGTSSFGNQIY